MPEPSSAEALVAMLDLEVDAAPSAQTAVDVVPGWNHSFPDALGVTAGAAAMYNDDRIRWCLDMTGSLEGRNVLELGPLEGMHTSMLATSGAAHVDAVEANVLAYIRCLITREILEIGPVVSFLLGDFTKWMRQPRERYGLVVASGVLYHAHDPVELLELICRCGDCVFIWTHYFDETALPREDARRAPFSGRVEERIVGTRRVALWERSYFKAWRDPRFCGGIRDQHFWMTKDGILGVLADLGFDTTVAHDQPDHVNGPCFSVFGRRRGEAPPDASSPAA